MLGSESSSAFGVLFKITLYYVGKKDDLPLSGAHVGRGMGTEICEGSVRYELGGATRSECEWV